MKYLKKSIDIDGKELTLEFGRMAHAATTSVFARLGDTCVLVVITIGKEDKTKDYFPLQVEYMERLYAGGIIKGSRWVKRGGRPTDESILSGRIIDRSIRPLFPKEYRRELQVAVTILSVDRENSPEILALNAVSAALHVSPAPWNGPVAGTQIGSVTADGAEGSAQLVVNPTNQQKEFSTLDLFAVSKDDKIIMIETAAHELPEDVIKQAFAKAKEVNAKIITFIEEIRKEIGMPKELVSKSAEDAKLKEIITKDFQKDIEAIVAQKAEREFDDGTSTRALADTIAEQVGEAFDAKSIAEAIDYLAKQVIRNRTMDTKKRIDGRGIDEIRALSAEVGILPRTHGTGMFQRGDTQVLSVATLGSPGLEQLLARAEGQVEKRYMQHYNFPPYSVGETGRLGFTSRREIGHGALAEKALIPVLPSAAEFPYVLHVVSEVMTSNGSTSMASTCGSSLALMDAGVPIKRPVAGIAMGLMSRSDDDYVILTDIMGIEDFSGEMDFKVTGTTEGVTAIQLDVKNTGLTDVMIEEILERAKQARLTIIEVMNKTIAEPRKELSPYAPKIETIKVDKELIGTVIGPGGKTIRAIIEATGTEVNVDDDGTVTVSGVDKAKVDEAMNTIHNLVRQIEVGEEFDGEVKRLMDFGAFVELVPGKDGLVHVSKMSSEFVKNPSEIVKEGDKVRVKVQEIDSQGRINLKLLTLPDGTPVNVPDGPPREERHGGGEYRGGDRGGDRGDRNSRPRRDDNRGPRRDDRRRF